mgnify:CR=1 FL=1
MAQMKYFYELTISSSPHAHSPVTTQTIMRDVLIALVPALLGSIYFFVSRVMIGQTGFEFFIPAVNV